MLLHFVCKLKVFVSLLDESHIIGIDHSLGLDARHVFSLQNLTLLLVE